MKIKCYICENIGHISIDCPEFKTKEGNLSKYYEKIKEKLEIKDEENESDLGKLTKGVAFDGDVKEKVAGEEGSKVDTEDDEEKESKGSESFKNTSSESEEEEEEEEKEEEEESKIE